MESKQHEAKTLKTKPKADGNITGRDKWLFPNDPELQVLHVTLPNCCMAEIDAAIEELHPNLKDREDSCTWLRNSP